MSSALEEALPRARACAACWGPLCSPCYSNADSSHHPRCLAPPAAHPEQVRDLVLAPAALALVRQVKERVLEHVAALRRRRALRRRLFLLLLCFLGLRARRAPVAELVRAHDREVGVLRGRVC